MLYLSLKTFHIVAAALWVGSLSLVCFVTGTTRMSPEHARAATRVTEASIGFTWLAGVVLVIWGNWYLSTWWYIKMAMVVLISAIHTILHRRWRQSMENGIQTNKLISPFILISTFFIVLLAVAKRPI